MNGRIYKLDNTDKENVVVITWCAIEKYLRRHYGFDYETAHNITEDSYFYELEHGGVDDFISYGLHKACQLSRNAYRDDKHTVIEPLEFEDDDGEIKENYNVSKLARYEVDISLLEAIDMLDCLTHREQQVIKMLYSGYTQTEISATFVVHKATVSKWIKDIRNKLTGNSN